MNALTQLKNGSLGMSPRALLPRTKGPLFVRAEASSSRSSRTLRLPKAPTSIRSFLASAVEIPRDRLDRLADLSPTRGTTTPDVALPSGILKMILLATAVSFICSLDRSAMSVAILPMSDTFHWDDSVKGAVSAAFFAGYMLTNLGGGFLATRYGPKKVLGAGVVLWSLFTLATPMAAGGTLTQLMGVRAVMGLGEGVAYPSVQNLVRDGVPQHARSRALAFIYSGHQLGTIASYVVAPILISQVGWESVFWVFGSLGFLWIVGWAPLVKADSKKAKHKLRVLENAVASSSTPAEAASLRAAAAPLRIQDVPWSKFAKNKSFWAIVAAQVTVGIGSCLSFSWLPTYYSEVYHVNVAQSATFCLVPFVATVVATNAAGWIADGLVNNGIMGKTETRKLMQTIASIGPAVCLLRLAATQGTEGTGVGDAVAMVTAWLALGGFSAAGYGANHQDISSKWAGVLFGLSNGLASIAGSASIFATGMVLHETHDWGLIFTGAAGMYALGAVVYLKWASCDEQFE